MKTNDLPLPETLLCSSLSEERKAWMARVKLDLRLQADERRCDFARARGNARRVHELRQWAADLAARRLRELIGRERAVCNQIARYKLSGKPSLAAKLEAALVADLAEADRLWGHIRSQSC